MKTLLFIFIFSPFIVNAQIISTYVDTTGIEGYTGDHGSAISAEIGRPLGMSLDDSGNLVVGTTGVYGLFRKINAVTSIITTIAGSDTASSLGHGGDGGPATCAAIIGPYGVCYDAAGNFYIADNWYSEVRKVSIATDIIDTFAGNRTGGCAGNNGLAKTAELNDPVSVCFDPLQHYLYISNEFGYTVRKVDMLTDTITAFAGTCVNGYSGDGGLAINAKFGLVLGICSDAAGNIYIGDWGNHRIRKVDAITGIVTTIAGTGIDGFSGDGGPATNAMIYYPFGLCFDKCGDLYFSDSNRVRRIDGVTGIINTVAGNGIAGFSGDSGLAVNAELNGATGIAIDTSGNLFISDCYNNRIRKVTIFNPFINISATPGDTVCAGSQVTIQATLAGGGATPTFQWAVNGTVMSGTTSSSYTYTPSNEDSISCILTSSSPCVGNPVALSNTIHLVVDTITIPTITLSGIPLAALGSAVTVNATVASAGSSYTINWYNNGMLFNTTTVPTVTYIKSAGTDLITATVIPTSAGCYDSGTSAVFTVTDTTTGINYIAIPQAYIYPNPAQKTITVIAPNITNIAISDFLGQTLISEDCNTSHININIEALPAGVYAVKLTSNDGQKTITKLVKQ